MSYLYCLEVRGRRLVRCDPDSGTVDDLVSDLREVPDGIVVSPVGERIYWTNMGAPDQRPALGNEPPFENVNGSIQSATLDGDDVRTIVPRGAFTTGKQLAIDADAGQLYWCDREGRSIWRAGTDGSEMTQLLDMSGRDGAAIDEMPVGIAIDPNRRQLYWTQKGPPKGGRGRIFRARLDRLPGSTATARDDVEMLWSGLPEPIDLQVTADGLRLYWTDRGGPPNGNSLNTGPIPERGEPAVKPTVLATGFREAIGVAIDEPAGLAYVSDLGGSLYRVQLDDQSVLKIVDHAGALTGIALVRS